MPVAISCSTNCMGGVAMKAASKSCSTRSSTPQAARSSRLRGNSQMSGGAYCGASSRAGCGPKVSALTGPRASRRAAAKSAWWPRCTPSKFPIAMAPPVSRLTDAERPWWMRIGRTDRGDPMRRQTRMPVLRVLRACALSSCLFLSRGPHAAEVRFDGSYRLRFNTDTNLLLDDQGFASGQKSWAEHRLRLTPKIVEIGENSGLEIQASFDILSGIFGGDVAADFRGYGLTDRSQRSGFRAQGFDFRYLFAQVRTNVGTLEIGQMPTQWGMGMLVNNGNGENLNDFGDARYGDIVDGVLFATRPLVSMLGPKSELGQKVGLAVAAELVYRQPHFLAELALGTEHGDQRTRGEEHAVDDVAVARVAEVVEVLAVAVVHQHAHAPLGGHLPDLQRADVGADLREQVAEVEALRPETAALGAVGEAVAAEVGRDVAAKDAGEDVEAGLDLEAGVLADLDDLRRQPQPVLGPPLLPAADALVVEQEVGIGVEAKAVAAVEAHFRGMRPSREEKTRAQRTGAEDTEDRHPCLTAHRVSSISAPDAHPPGPLGVGQPADGRRHGDRELRRRAPGPPGALCRRAPRRPRSRQRADLRP